MSESTTPQLRPSGILLVAGAVLVLVGNILHPVDADPGPLSRISLADGADWMAIHLVIAAGILAVVSGLVQLSRQTGQRRGLPASLATLSAMLGGGLMILVFAGLDGFAQRSLASAWATADSQARVGLEGAAVALEAVDTAVAGVGTLLLFGLASIAVAAVVRHGDHGPAWLTTVMLLAGVLGLATGGAMLVSGPTEFTINVLLRPMAAATTFSWLVLGISLVRRAGAVSSSAASGSSVTPVAA